MDIITIEGDALRDLLDELAYVDVREGRPYRLRVARDVDGIKYKLDEGIWTPPYPEADEDVRRRERAVHPSAGGAP